MKVSELLKEYSEKWTDYELYRYVGTKRNIHTDNIKSVCGTHNELEVLDYALIDEEEYDKTVLANACESADFEDWYDDKNAKVLVIIVE